MNPKEAPVSEKVLNMIKDMAAKQVGRVLASETTMKVLGSSELRQVVVTAINLRAAGREALEARIKDLASTLELATREDMAHLRRSMRDMEDQLAELHDQLDEAQQELAASRAAEEAAKESADEAKAAPLAHQETALKPAAKKARKAKAD